MDKTVLIDQLKVTLATAFSLYLKAHNFHWNITGPNFIQYHSFLNDVYDQVHDSVDAYAEHIRALGAFAPGSLSRYSELTKIADEVSIPTAKNMIARIASDNAILLSELRLAVSTAEELKEHGVLNFLEGQIDAHEKLQWMLRSFEEA